MQEFIKKVIERLEKEGDSANDKIVEQETEKDMAYYDGFEDGCDKAIEIVNQLAKEYNNESVNTNADYIRSLSDEELAEQIMDFQADCIINNCFSNVKSCMDWLKSEREG